MKLKKISDYTSLNELARRQIVLLKGLTPRKVPNAAGIYYEYLTRKTVLKHKPVLLKIEPSTHCNLRCPTCHPDGNVTGGTMDLDTFQMILDRVPLEYFLKCTLYMFGEPMFNKNIYRMVSEVDSHNIPTSISTNFHIFNEKAADELFASGLTWILVCIDGASQETYEIYRVGGDLERVKRNVELLVAEKKRRESKLPIIEAQSVIFDHNIHETDEIRSMCLDLGVDRFTSKRDVFTQLDYDRDNRPEPSGNGDRKKKRSCYFLYGTLMIDYDGAVIPCCLGRNVFGDLKESTFDEIWNNDRFVAARRWFASDFTEKDDRFELPCYTCPLFM